MQSEVNQEENLNTTDFDEHFAKISSYIVDTLHGVPLEMTEDEKEQFRIQVISNQYAERLLSEAEKTETYERIKVGTADATLGTNNSGGRTGYVLVWEKDGISHTIIGKIPREEILKIAESIS